MDERQDAISELKRAGTLFRIQAAQLLEAAHEFGKISPCAAVLRLKANDLVKAALDLEERAFRMKHRHLALGR